MPGLNDAFAQPALKAYAQVQADGTTPHLNSAGMTVGHPSTGIYLLNLPAALGINIKDGLELVLIQIKSSGTDFPITALYIVNSASQIEVHIWEALGGSNIRLDNAFNFFLFETALPLELAS
jgi:hypothetical protein